MRAQGYQDYEDLAALLRYPGADHRRTALSAAARFPETLSDFAEYAAGRSRTEMEELYTRTFDIQAICFLEIGYVLFGEDYKRGHLLVKLKELLEEFRVDPRGELADHLPNLLELLPRLKAARSAEAEAFVDKLVLPALEMMTRSFAEKGNVYAGPIRAVRELLRRDFPECRGASTAPGREAGGIPLPAYRNDEMMGDAYDG